MISTGIDNGRALRNNDPSILQERGESFKDSPCATREKTSNSLMLWRIMITLPRTGDGKVPLAESLESNGVPAPVCNAFAG
jgi:hypothetical protein